MKDRTATHAAGVAIVICRHFAVLTVRPRPQAKVFTRDLSSDRSNLMGLILAAVLEQTALQDRQIRGGSRDCWPAMGN